MHGSPLLRAAIVIFVLLLAAIPIWSLTHQAAASMDSVPQAAATKSPIRIELAFAHEPADFQVLYLGKVIWEEKQPRGTPHKNFDIEFPTEGIDLEIKANWPAGTPLTAVRATVTHGYGSTDQTAWGKETLDQVFTFKDPK